MVRRELRVAHWAPGVGVSVLLANLPGGRLRHNGRRDATGESEGGPAGGKGTLGPKRAPNSALFGYTEVSRAGPVPSPFDAESGGHRGNLAENPAISGCARLWLCRPAARSGSRR